MIGTLRGAQEVGGAAIDTLGNTVENLSGAIAGAKSIGVDASQAASAAAVGALSAAGDIGAEAIEQVRRAATGTISGVKVVVKEPFRKQ